jgi:hypothetical protein
MEYPTKSNKYRWFKRELVFGKGYFKNENYKYNYINPTSSPGEADQHEFPQDQDKAECHLPELFKPVFTGGCALDSQPSVFGWRP